MKTYTRDYSYLPAVKVILAGFIEKHLLEAEIETVMDCAMINIDDDFEVEESEEVLDVCRYLIAKNLVTTFFGE